jgi:hypothetical protein
MIRVVLDTNVIVSALLAPAGTQASVLLLAFGGDVSLYLSEPVFSEYSEVLRRPRFKLDPRQVQAGYETSARLRALFNHLVNSPSRPANPIIACSNVPERQKQTISSREMFGTFLQFTKGRKSLRVAGFWISSASSDQAIAAHYFFRAAK